MLGNSKRKSFSVSIFDKLQRKQIFIFFEFLVVCISQFRSLRNVLTQF